MHAHAVQRGDRATGRVAETENDATQMPPIVPGCAVQRHGMQHRAVACHLVVQVEHVHHVFPIGSPVVHGLPCDQRELLVNRDLRQFGVLNSMRPAPHDLPVPQCVQVLQRGLGQQHDVCGGDDLLAARYRRQLDPSETLAVPGLEHHALAQIRFDALDVVRMDRQAQFVLLAGGREYP